MSILTQFAEAAAFFRSSDIALFPANEYPQVIEDTTSGKVAPDLELFVSPIGYLKHAQTRLPNRTSLGLHLVLLRYVLINCSHISVVIFTLVGHKAWALSR
jgi:choline dehydrogenase